MKGAEETEVKITQRLYHDKSLVWTVYVDGEIFYKECRSFGRHFKKSGSKLEAFIDWLAGNEPDNIKINLSLLNHPNNRQNHQTDTSEKVKEVQRFLSEKVEDAFRSEESMNFYLIIEDGETKSLRPVQIWLCDKALDNTEGGDFSELVKAFEIALRNFWDNLKKK